MNSNLKLLPAALLVAVLALAGCGGGGSDDMTPTEPPTPEPQPPASVERLSLDIQEAQNDAEAAKKMAEEALANAKKSEGMLGTEDAAGDSGAAMMAAQAILDADMDIGEALADAEGALEDAMAAKTKVMALADDHPEKATLMTSVDRVVKMAEMYVAAVKAIRDGTDLEDYVAAVKGNNGKGTTRDIADKVGEAIATALVAPTQGNTAPPDAVAAKLKVVMDDAMGMTWAEMVGEDNLMTLPIGTDRAPVKVASIAGRTLNSVWGATAVTNGITGVTDLAGAAATNGGLFTTAFYSGIPGSVYCLGTDCKVVDGKLAGSWYFAQTAADAAKHYVRNPDRVAGRTTPYVEEGLYATYGHWLAVATDGTATVTTFATTAGNTTNTEANLAAGTEDNGLDDTATYSGGAAGMSVRTQGSGDDKTTDSGRFTADVMLHATFGTAPIVRGTINNFKGGAVNSAWNVTLERATLATGSSNNGVTSAGSADGTWSAQAYGTGSSTGDAVRPSGVFGNFTANFSDGAAAGAYATLKD